MNNTVLRNRLRLGLLYGLIAGLAFAVFAWGIDAVLLASANGSYFGVKFFPGLIISLLAGGCAGWLTLFFHKHSLAILFWGLLAVLLSWLVVWLPFSATPKVIRVLNPGLAQWFKFSPIQDQGQFWLVSFLIIGAVAILCGMLEINLIDQAAVSPYLAGPVTSLLVCIVLFGLAGSATDHMINTNLREPVQVINTMLQFAHDNYGVDVPKDTARKLHLSATKQLGELVTKPRRLFLVGFDEELGMIDVLVDFAGTQAKCTAIFAQPTDCTIQP